jgi:hypothetical protein
METSGELHTPAALTTAYSTHWIGSWVNSGDGLGVVERGKILPLPGPACSMSLYRLSYPDQFLRNMN